MTTHEPNALPEHVRENRRYWNDMAADWVEGGERDWAAPTPVWGVWRVPESELSLLPTDMTGRDAIELGCGTGYVSSWMVRRGARVVGIDNSQEQLATARRLANEHQLDIEFIHGNAETVPLDDGSFDFAISEFGAATWCDPYVWIPEAHRLLRAGGTLVFLANSPFASLATPPSGADCEPRLHRSYFDLHRLDWTDCEVDPGGIEFSLPISKWFALFRETGFDVLDYREIQAPAERTEPAYNCPINWGRQWPYEHVWSLRKG